MLCYEYRTICYVNGLGQTRNDISGSKHVCV